MIEGPFDPNTYDPADPATYPTPAAPGALYLPGMFWRFDTGGTFDGVPVSQGDRVYAVGDGEGPWTVGDVGFVAWIPAAEPWDDTAPPPYAGCPLGAYAPGWRIVVEGWFIADDRSRTYGTDTYGDGVYGDDPDVDEETWSEISHSSFGVRIRRGSADGEWSVPVDEIVLDLVDADADTFPLSEPASWFSPGVGTLLRVGLLDPTRGYHPLAVGRIDRVDDVHDAGVRTVTVDAFGLSSQLVKQVRNWLRPYESATSRIERMLYRARWRWSPTTYPPDVPNLNRDRDYRDVEARGELDRIALSAGWHFDTTAAGALRFRPWPIESNGAPLVEVADCRGSDALVTHRIGYEMDTAQLLNVVTASNLFGVSATSTDDSSIHEHGTVDSTYGFPVDDLASLAADVEPLTAKIRDRLGENVRRARSFEADTSVDPRWFDVLADLDTGQPVRLTRTAFPAYPLTLDVLVVGIEHRIISTRWSTTCTLFPT